MKYFIQVSLIAFICSLNVSSFEVSKDSMNFTINSGNIYLRAPLEIHFDT